MMDHKDFPQMTEEFDRRVRQTLEALPEQPQRARRFPMKRIVSAGLAAALCLGGTAFAASDLPAAIGRTFTLLLHGEDAQLLRDYTVTPEPGTICLLYTSGSSSAPMRCSRPAHARRCRRLPNGSTPRCGRSSWRRRRRASTSRCWKRAAM